MFDIFFYEDANGDSPVYDFMQNLAKRTDKNSRVNLNKISDYIQVLSVYGKAAGEPYIKHIEDDIWELRPIRNRVFFASWNNKGFILLHYFQKKTQKTPRREIDQAKRNLLEAQKRSDQK